MPNHLPSYLRSRRKRWHLTQRELAFLLGVSSQAVVSQHEQVRRIPHIRVFLKYEILFGEPIGDLFPKLDKDVKTALAARTRALAARLAKRQDKASLRKRQLLAEVAKRCC